MNEPIRILHVVTAMNFAGTETLLMNFYRNIDRQKVQFDFAVSVVNECGYDDEIKKLGGKIIHYPKYTGKNHVQYVKWWKVFLNRHPQYHIIHGHIGSTAAIYLEIAKKLGRYAIAHSHAVDASLSLQSILYKIYSYPTRYIADYYFGCSKQALIDRYGNKVANDKRKARVLNNAIDVGKYAYDETLRKKVREEFKIPPDSLVIGTVGRLTFPKNPFEILRICENLKERNMDYVFLWFGMGELYDEVEQGIREKNLSKWVRLCGIRPDIYKVLQAMDIFIFPSVYEGLGIAGVEAQAAGLPTLCSNIIPVEAKVTELCEFLKLNDTKLWCDRIQEIAEKVQSHDYKRLDTREIIKKAGFDIKAVSNWLERFYLECSH